MTLTEQEIEALRAYFDETTINISSLMKKIGKEKVKMFEKVIEKVYDWNTENKIMERNI